MRKFKEIPKREKLFMVQRLICIILGSFMLAFGSAVFLYHYNIISGGLSGIAIIIRHYVGEVEFFGDIGDLVVTALTWILWLIGLIFGGKVFAFRTLLASIFYPLFFALCLRLNIGEAVATQVGADNIGSLLVIGIFAGIFVGCGVALNFVGGGSSGGIDVIIYLVEKKFGIKHSIQSFLIDGAIVLIGLICIPNNLKECLCGIISALVTSLVIEFVYGGSTSSYQIDVISSKWEDISQYAQDKLGRGTTVIKAAGGYKGEERTILRIVFPKYQYTQLKNYISIVDPKAFVTFTKTNAVYGEGFKINTNSSVKKVENSKENNE